MSFIIIIPARYASTRLPRKPLVDINGKSMIVHVLDRARESGADRIIVATDCEEIASKVKIAGGEVCITHTNHKSGTERLSEVIDKYNFSDETIIVNLQGDEPIIPAKIIQQVAKTLIDNYQLRIATLAVSIHDIKEVFNPNTVKVVIDSTNHALYFSRAAIPWNKNKSINNKKILDCTFLRHIGIYAYRASFIRRYISWKPSLIEKIEMLEQLRILWYGEKIYVFVTKEKIPKISSVDTLDDLIYVRSILR